MNTKPAVQILTRQVGESPDEDELHDDGKAFCQDTFQLRVSGKQGQRGEKRIKLDKARGALGLK